VIRQEIENCNTEPCPPTWSSWTVLTSPEYMCTASCGGGTVEQRSNCLNAEEMWSTLCEGKILHEVNSKVEPIYFTTTFLTIRVQKNLKHTNTFNFYLCIFPVAKKFVALQYNWTSNHFLKVCLTFCKAANSQFTMILSRGVIIMLVTYTLFPCSFLVKPHPCLFILYLCPRLCPS